MWKHSEPSHAGITRREALLMLGASVLAGPALAQTAQKPACLFTPEQTEGPYFSDARLNRADIRSDPRDGTPKPGVPLLLALTVKGIEGSRCAPLPGAVVDVWHCDAAGIYSDVPEAGEASRGKKFLRGYQTTDKNGAARFTTIYPGSYPGRAIHVHFKVRAKDGQGRPLELTSQLYFPDDVNATVLALPAYAAQGSRVPPNGTDGLFRRGGRELLLRPKGSPGDGYTASFDIGLMIG